MPATPIYALPYPAPSDPADMPLDLQELADRIEAILNTQAAEILTQEALNSASYADLATAGPSVTVPIAGVWEISFGAKMGADAGWGGLAAVKLGGAAASDNEAIEHGNPAGANVWVSASRTLVRTLAAGTVLKMQYKNNGGGSAYFARRFIVARFVRP